MRYYAPEYRRRSTAAEISAARYRGRYRGRRDAWDHVPDRGDFDDMGRADRASTYHAGQKHRQGRF